MLVKSQNCTLCGAQLVEMVLTRGLWTANASNRGEVKDRKAVLVALIHTDLDVFSCLC